jgi:hypothetical protein
MKRLLISAGIALAAAAVHAQESPAPSAPATSQQEAEARASVTGHTDQVYHGPHRYPMKERGKHAGDPPIIDHSMDTLVVEPTHSSITVTTPP